MSNRSGLNLDVDLQRGVVPISKAASSLAALIKRAHQSGQPVVVTQKGYPTGVLLPIELFTALKAMAEGDEGAQPMALPGEIDAIIETQAEEDEGAGRRSGGQRRRRTSPEPTEGEE